MPTRGYVPPVAPETMNTDIADRLDQVADLLRDRDANPFRVQAWRRAAETIRTLPESVGDLFHREDIDGLERLPAVGPVIARAIRTMVLTGWFPMLQRLREASDPERVLATVPGIGPVLARRLHEELGIETLEQLELAAHDGSLRELAGFGEKKIRGIREALAGRLARGRARPAPPSGEPPVEELLDVDREYREKAAAGQLRKITPRRFNPQRRAWLPVLHTRRGDRHYTALFSNTAQAHRLGRTRDWVVLYYDGADGERQCTVVTATAGPLRGMRVVRGREAECERLLSPARPRRARGSSRRRGAAMMALALVLALGAACGGGDAPMPDETPPPAAGTGFDTAAITPRMLALGDSIFHGLIGAASCQACHGPDATGGAAAPDLVDEVWLHSDGSFESIYLTIKSGVFAPKQYPGVMLPYGGAALTEEQTRAVAAWVFMERHRQGR